MTSLQSALAANPMIAILRGLDPAKAIATADVLVEAGFRIIEVPMNSPEPLKSIERIADRFGDQVIVGAGTVLSAGQVTDVADAGGRIIVAPNMDGDVGRAARARNLFWCPGVLSPTEAFTAVAQGAAILKFFPAEMMPPPAIAAVHAVLPAGTVKAVVGGIAPESLLPYRKAGCEAFGIGSSLFRPDYSVDEVRRRAESFVKAVETLKDRP